MSGMDSFSRGRGYRDKHGGHDADELNGLGIGLDTRTLLIIKLPDSLSLRIVSRSLFLAVVLLALPSLGSIMRASSNAPLYDYDADSAGFEILPILLHDLQEEGLIKKGDKGLVLGPAIEDNVEFLRDAGVDLLTGAGLRRQIKAGEHRVFDYVYVPSFSGIHLIDSIVKDGGLVISPWGLDPSDDLQLLSSFKIVYLRRFEITAVAMRKMEGPTSPVAEQAFCGVTPEKKKAALKGLEEVYLEPPRRSAMAKRSIFTSRKIKFLPDLLKDPLDEYPRRVFISDDSNAIDWFYKNYPVRDQEFEVYNEDVLLQGLRTRELGSDWLRKIVSAEDYVVMKAEAEAVEQMIRDKTMCLVDELFLECKNEREDGEERGEEGVLAVFSTVW